jgi:hypothetical protein
VYAVWKCKGLKHEHVRVFAVIVGFEADAMTALESDIMGKPDRIRRFDLIKIEYAAN